MNLLMSRSITLNTHTNWDGKNGHEMDGREDWKLYVCYAHFSMALILKETELIGVQACLKIRYNLGIDFCDQLFRKFLFV